GLMRLRAPAPAIPVPIHRRENIQLVAVIRGIEDDVQRCTVRWLHMEYVYPRAARRRTPHHPPHVITAPAVLITHNPGAPGVADIVGGRVQAQRGTDMPVPRQLIR